MNRTLSLDRQAAIRAEVEKHVAPGDIDRLTFDVREHDDGLATIVVHVFLQLMAKPFDVRLSSKTSLAVNARLTELGEERYSIVHLRLANGQPLMKVA